MASALINNCAEKPENIGRRPYQKGVTIEATGNMIKCRGSVERRKRSSTPAGLHTPQKVRRAHSASQLIREQSHTHGETCKKQL